MAEFQLTPNNLRRLLFFILVVKTVFAAQAQIAFSESPFVDIRLYVDTSSYSWEEDKITYLGRDYLPWEYHDENEVAEVYLYFPIDAEILDIHIMPSSDFEVQDSIFMIDDHARMKVKFRDLTNADFLKFSFKVRMAGGLTEYIDVPLFPYTQTFAKYYAPDDQLYIGEEKVTEITTNRPENIVVDNRWTEDQPINYQMKKEGNRILLNLEPTQLGNHSIRVPITLKRPYIKDGEVHYELPAIEQTYSIKSGRLAFLQLDEQEITPNDDRTEPIVVQIQSSRYLRIGKTYRIENQEERGGALVAELFTKSRLNNDKVLCLLRPYAHHRKSDGYLYIKDGDDPQFVTNVDITPKSQITAIYLQREGGDWEKSNKVYPGENLNVRIEGVALHKSQFSFPGVQNLQSDSLIRNETIALFKIRVPIDISANKIEIFDRASNTNKYLEVKEYQRPRKFDYVHLELGKEDHLLSDVNRPIYYEGNLSDLVISFDRTIIDQNRDLNGKQYLNIKVKVSNKDGNLIELYEMEEVVVYPSEQSLRYAHYNDNNYQGEGINLNNHLSKKTYDMDEWSRIELTISHVKEKYEEKTQSKKVQVYLKRRYNFDIDVSFPGGLLILKKEEEEDPNTGATKKKSQFSNFSGVSFAMLAQFSFYQPGKIAKYQPYKLGAGFIAIDAFNFSENSANRDVGLVVIGSLYPSSGANRKLTFPLYAGFGYLMKEKKVFSLIGPGIRVRF